MSKVCKECLIEKPLTEFHIKDRARGRRCTKCKKCANIAYRLKRSKLALLPIKGKICTKCNRYKAKKHFSFDRYAKGGIYPSCKMCDMKYRKKNRDKLLAGARSRYPRYFKKRRERVLERIYKMRPGQYAEMHKTQKGLCKICGGSEEVKGRYLAVDHCHKTGKVRALLCSRCNLGLGHFNDDSAVVRKALEYLEEYTII